MSLRSGVTIVTLGGTATNSQEAADMESTRYVQWTCRVCGQKVLAKGGNPPPARCARCSSPFDAERRDSKTAWVYPREPRPSQPKRWDPLRRIDIAPVADRHAL